MRGILWLDNCLDREHFIHLGLGWLFSWVSPNFHVCTSHHASDSSHYTLSALPIPLSFSTSLHTLLSMIIATSAPFAASLATIPTFLLDSIFLMSRAALPSCFNLLFFSAIGLAEDKSLQTHKDSTFRIQVQCWQNQQSKQVEYYRGY